MVHGFLITVASLVAEHRLWGTWASVVVVHGLSCPKAGGILVSGSGIEPMSPELASGVLTAGPPQKSLSLPFSYLLSAGERAEDSCFSSPTRPWVCTFVPLYHTLRAFYNPSGVEAGKKSNYGKAKVGKAVSYKLFLHGARRRTIPTAALLRAPIPAFTVTATY